MALGLTASLVSGASLAAPGNDPVVMTSYGPVRGLRNGGCLRFAGVRYGADTSTTRFARPQPPTRWQETRDALAFGPACPQPGSEPNPSEDCLFLNIWTPDADPRARRPVMVYIHGGAYATGSGSSPLTDGTALATEHDVVVVTLNHRLNVFGYLYLDQIAPGFRPDGGNAGQWDLIAALQWVQANIARFGGDPARVMLFGQSGGGAKIATLMATPAADNLFHGAATMSGQQVTASGPLNATRRARTMLAALGVAETRPQALLDVPAQALVDALSSPDPVNNEQRLYFGPVVDQIMLDRHPFWPDAPPRSRHRPMILGNVKNETRNLIGRGAPEAFNLSDADLPQWLARHMRTDIAPSRVIATYRQHHPTMTASDLFFAATTAARSWRGQVEEADARARQGAPTWVYRLDLPSPDDGGKWGAFHTLDIPHAFKTLSAEVSMTGTAPEAVAVSKALSGALVALARTGTPRHPGLPAWPTYSLERRETLILDRRIRVESDPRGFERALFATTPFIQWGS